jgi:hypothetical protein
MLQTNEEPGEKVKMEDDSDGTEEWLEDVIPPLLSSTSSATSPGATTTSLVLLVSVEQRRRSCLLAAELRLQLNNTVCEVIKGNQEDDNTLLLERNWANDDISYGTSYLQGIL